MTVFGQLRKEKRKLVPADERDQVKGKGKGRKKGSKRKNKKEESKRDRLCGGSGDLLQRRDWGSFGQTAKRLQNRE